MKKHKQFLIDLLERELRITQSKMVANLKSKRDLRKELWEIDRLIRDRFAEKCDTINEILDELGRKKPKKVPEPINNFEYYDKTGRGIEKCLID